MGGGGMCLAGVDTGELPCGFEVSGQSPRCLASSGLGEHSRFLSQGPGLEEGRQRLVFSTL